ncbi:MAG: dTMP kinase [Candidatus Aerophobetes bacterium]|nr:dTMP kinase [Candidatus Aerophobetes bacterium]
MFISFEGIDKSGKSTQVSLLSDYLRNKGYEVIKTCEPGGTKLGEKIKALLLHSSNKISEVTELFLYLADRKEHIEKVIKPALREREIVICDRFLDATVAYQGYGRGLDIAWIDKLNEITTQGILPDITFLLDIYPSLSKQRGGEDDRIEEEKVTFYEKVRQGYLEIAKSYPKRIKVIKGELTLKEIHLTIRKIVLDQLCLLHR